jgi:phage-related baseplate assembly protein
MSNRLNLALLPPLDVVQQVDFQLIVDDIVARAALENASPSDPAYRVVLAAAYREMTLRQSANDMALGLTLAFASGAELDHLGVTYYRHPDGSPVLRLTEEQDGDFKNRLQQSPEGLSVAGPDDAYKFHALSASADVKAVEVNSPAPVQMDVYILAKTGVPEQNLLDLVEAYLWPRRPITDHVTVKAAELVNYTVTATLYMKSGPDGEIALATAQARIDIYVEQRRILKGQVNVSSVHWALTVEGVERVALTNWTDIVCLYNQAPNCTGITLTKVVL